MKKRWLLGLTLAAVLVAANRPTPPWEKSRVSVGEDLFRENCAVCHEINKMESKKIGPSLYHAFKREKLASGSKPSRLYIMTRVKFGGGPYKTPWGIAQMPAFAKKMTDPEINTLIDYIESK